MIKDFLTNVNGIVATVCTIFYIMAIISWFHTTPHVAWIALVTALNVAAIWLNGKMAFKEIFEEKGER